MAELPVQDRSARQVAEVIEIRPHAAYPQPVRTRGSHHRQRGDAVPAGSGHVPQLAEIDALAEVAEHHGQAGRAAVGVFHLPDERDRPAHGAFPLLSIARNWRPRRSASDSDRSTTDAWVRTCASSRTEAAPTPGFSWPVTKMAGWAERRQPGLPDGGVVGQLGVQAADPDGPAAGERDGESPRARQVRADRSWQQKSDRAGSAIDDRGTRGTLVGVDDPHGGYGHQHEDKQHPVGPVDPPGPEAHHAARGVASPDTELQRFSAEDRLPVGRRGRRAAGQLQGRPGTLGRDGSPTGCVAAETGAAERRGGPGAAETA